MTDKRRISLPPYTRGWFQIGWSSDLKRGELKKIRQFGTSFAMFRGKDGKVGVIDDICPHLGAHFSEGGTVQGNAVRCPYHHWCFDRSGDCVDIPYAKKIPAKARVGTYHVAERYGLIFMYHSQDGARPPAELPMMDDFVEQQYDRPATYEFAIRIHGQDIMENSVDSAHFRAVHGHNTPENFFHEEGKELRITQAVSLRRFGVLLKGRLEFHMIEPGFHYLHFPQVMGTQAQVFSSIVPIDAQSTNHRLTIWIRKSMVPGWSRILRHFVVSEMMRTYHEDMQIWENKEYLPHPVLCDGDGSIMKLRRWYAQFFESTTLDSSGIPIPKSAVDTLACRESA